MASGDTARRRDSRERPDPEHLGPGFTPETDTGQEIDFEPELGPIEPGPGYTPQERTEEAQDENSRMIRHTGPGIEQNLPSDVEEGPRRGTFVNEETGEVRYFGSNPPDSPSWHLLAADDIPLDQARRLVRSAGFFGIDPSKLYKR